MEFHGQGAFALVLESEAEVRRLQRVKQADQNNSAIAQLTDPAQVVDVRIIVKRGIHFDCGHLAGSRRRAAQGQREVLRRGFHQSGGQLRIGAVDECSALKPVTQAVDVRVPHFAADREGAAAAGHAQQVALIAHGAGDNALDQRQHILSSRRGAGSGIDKILDKDPAVQLQIVERRLPQRRERTRCTHVLFLLPPG